LLALAEANQLRFELKPINLTDLAETILGLFSALAGERNIKLKLEAEANLPEVLVDPQRFQQVVGNLIDNALRYTPEGSSIDLIIHRTEKTVELTVADEGPGIPENELGHIFDRFWRGEKSRARSTGGAGLGLSIARQLVEAQGGQITAHNRPGGGFEVQITLPVYEPSISKL
jgi:two-component system sensor histidine kinase BaeS